MAEIPISMQVMIYPKNKTVPPYPATIVGFAWITGLHPDGGPILPPDQIPPVEPPLTIWPNPPEGIAPLPEHPIALPGDPWWPTQPPVSPPDVVQPPHEGWNWKPSTTNSPAAGWFYLYIPGPTDPQPKTPPKK